jgi:hypothetical protein
LQGVHLVLDRRIDPDAMLAGEFPSATLGSLLESIGKDHGFGVVPIEGVIYLGPPETVRRLRTLDHLRTHEIQTLKSRTGSPLLFKSSLAWPDLTSPRALVEQVCGEGRVTLRNPDLLPHDLWAANELPLLSRATQLTVLLAGFDLTFQCDGEGVTLLPIPDDVRWSRTYALPANRRGILNPIRQQLPGAELAVDQNRLHVTGLVEDHEAVQEWLEHGRELPAPETRPANRPGEKKLYTLRVVRRPLRAVLQEIEKLTEYRFVLDEAALSQAGASLDQSVSFDVVQVDIDGLMEAILGPGNLTWRRQGAQIEITANSSR